LIYKLGDINQSVWHLHAIVRDRSNPNYALPWSQKIIMDLDYDAVGNTVTVGDSIANVSAGLLTYSYDVLNRSTSISQTDTGVQNKHIDMTYNAISQVIKLSRFRGASSAVETTYGYDSSQRLTQIAHKQGSTFLAGYDYTYDGSDPSLVAFTFKPIVLQGASDVVPSLESLASLTVKVGEKYYRARYYDAAVGRFIGEDPIEFKAGDANLSRYVGNNSINSKDPMGLEVYAIYSKSRRSLTIIDMDTEEMVTTSSKRPVFSGDKKVRSFTTSKGPIPNGTYAIVDNYGDTEPGIDPVPHHNTFFRLDYMGGNCSS
jgi:RHS repeat-associated protein